MFCMMMVNIQERSYTDYNTFAANPSKYFIMVTKKPSGYVIPEESMTLPD